MKKLLICLSLLLSIGFTGCETFDKITKDEINYSQVRYTKNKSLFTRTEKQFITCYYYLACGDIDAATNYMIKLQEQEQGGLSDENIEVYVVDRKEYAIRVRIKGTDYLYWMSESDLK